MSASVFSNKSDQPTFATLNIELDGAYGWLDKVTQFIESEYGNISMEWKFYGQKSGWVLKILSGKRNVLFLIPQKGQFDIVFTFGEKAVQSILADSFSEELKNRLLSERKYAEGTSLRVSVDSDESLKTLIALIRKKIEV